MHSTDRSRRERRYDRPSSITPGSSTSLLSPRQRFQSHVRTLSDDSLTLSPSHATGHRHDRLQLKHVSSLRVQSGTPENSNTSRPSPIYRHSDSELHGLHSPISEPDFVREEREAWNRRSPTHTSTEELWPLRFSSLIETNNTSTLRPLQRPLRQFALSKRSLDVENRPGTSYGNRPNLELAEEDTMHELENGAETNKPRSKFLEGSMNKRSQGVASSWQGPGHNANDTEDDAGYDRRESDSLDLADFQPPTLPTSMVKRTLHRLKSKVNMKEGQDGHKALRQETGKTLRHSRSVWNMEKIGHTFKRSERRLTAGKTPKKIGKGSPQKSDKELLNERKRKAEAAYAEQFGIKKQKPQQQSPVTPGPTQNFTDAVTSSILWTRTTSDLRQQPDRVLNTGTHTPGRRPSRKELEAENDKLRALLRQNKSESNLNLDIGSPIYTAVPGTEADDPPPLPIFPPVPVLDVITNQQIRKDGRNGQSHTSMKRPRSTASRPVSTILEEDEEPCASKTWTAVEQNQKDAWQWPDDVF